MARSGLDPLRMDGAQSPARPRPPGFLEFAMQWRALQMWLSGTRVSLGVEVGVRQIKVACLHLRRGRSLLSDVWVKPIPLEVGGRPEQRMAFLRGALTEYLRQAKVPFLAEAHLAVSGPEVFTASFLVPRGEPSAIERAVLGEFRQRLGFPLEQAAFDFSLSPQTTELEGGRSAVFVVACPASWIQELVAACRSVRLVPALITAGPCAIHRFFQQTEFASSGQSLAVLEIGFSGSTLIFLYKGYIEYVRSLPVGTEHFIRGLLRTVATARGEHAITASEAEEIVEKYGVGTEEAVLPVAGGLKDSQVYGMLRPILENLFLEVQRTVQYYLATYQRPRGQKLLVCGTGACVPHLVEFLNANSDEMPVERVDLPSLFHGWADSDPAVMDRIARRGAEFIGPIGAACPSPPHLAAVPKLYHFSFQMAFGQWVALWLAGIGLGATLLLTVNFHFLRVRAEHLLREAQVRLEQMAPQVQRIQEYERQEQVLAQRSALMEQAQGRRPRWAGVLKELSRITPEGIHLISVDSQEDAAGMVLKIAGEILASYTEVEVLYLQYQLDLEQSPFFSEIQLVTMKKDLYSPIPRATFEIHCRLAY